MIPVTGTHTVYHGTSLFAAKVIKEHGIWLSVQRRLTDFGRGFYVTFNREQAKRWAQVRAQFPQVDPSLLHKLQMTREEYFNHPDTWQPAYLTFQLNLTRLNQLKGKIFPLPDQPGWPAALPSWKRFVEGCRSGRTHTYDFVYGPVGSRHPTLPHQIQLSYKKEQLALNSPKALKCLSPPVIFTLSESKSPSKKKRVPAWAIIKHFFTRGSTLASRSVQHPFLKAIEEELIALSNESRGSAPGQLGTTLLSSMPVDWELLDHEPPLYWAFSLLSGRRCLWYPEYEDYLQRKMAPSYHYSKSARSS